MRDAAVFFTSGGGESVETAVKLVRRYWSLLDRPERTVIVSRDRAYHGLAGYGTSIVGSDIFKVGVAGAADLSGHELRTAEQQQQRLLGGIRLRAVRHRVARRELWL